jgi:hypothetical protein
MLRTIVLLAVGAVVTTIVAAPDPYNVEASRSVDEVHVNGAPRSGVECRGQNVKDGVEQDYCVYRYLYYDVDAGSFFIDRPPRDGLPTACALNELTVLAPSVRRQPSSLHTQTVVFSPAPRRENHGSSSTAMATDEMVVVVRDKHHGNFAHGFVEDGFAQAWAQADASVRGWQFNASLYHVLW